MAIFGRGKGVDADELLDRVREKQEELVAQLDNLEAGDGSRGGGARFFLGLLLGVGLGAALLYLLDPERGEERRQSLMGVAGGFGSADDLAERDREVNERVEGELFRDASVPKDQININTVDGVVYVRGTASGQEQIAEIERRIKAIDGVDAVINLLRLPATAQA